MCASKLAGPLAGRHAQICCGIGCVCNMGGKWLELLKEVAPSVKRVAVLRDRGIPQGIGQLGPIQSLGPSLGEFGPRSKMP